MRVEKVRQKLRVATKGRPSIWANNNGIWPSIVTDVLSGKRAPTPPILRLLGLRKVVTITYERINPEGAPDGR